MPERVRTRPQADETAEYYLRYTSLVPDGDIVELLRGQIRQSVSLFEGCTEEQGAFRYAPGKWSLKEVLGHLVDTEWVFSYRALRMARGDGTPLADMDQDRFVAGGEFATRSLDSLIREWSQLRAANTTLFESFSDEVLTRTGTASGCDFSVRGLLYVIAGHELHHVGVVRERYL